MRDVASKLDLVVVRAAQSPPRQALAREIALRIGADVISDAEAEHDYRLIVNDDRIELCDRTMIAGRGVSADFSAIDVRSITKREPIAKAMGRGTRTIIDATGGLGHDAFRLACMGYGVTAVERSPVVALLLEDGLRRAIADERLGKTIGGRLRVLEGDARSVLPRLPAADVVYLDPMFPPKRKDSALPKKEMRLLQNLLGDDPDAGELFDIARQCATRRVVAKRPLRAPPLAPKPVASHKGKLARFDVYVP